VDGEWTPVPNDRINNVVAPDGGAHVCAPRQVGPNKGVLFCVVSPGGLTKDVRLRLGAPSEITYPVKRPLYRAVAMPNRCACQRRWLSINVEMKK
jgi:hypothetical protein